MILAKNEDDAKVELLTTDECSIHYGTVSFRLSIENFFKIALLFNADTEDAPDSKVCSVMKVTENRFVFCFKGMTLAMCGGALSGFAAMINESERKYLELFNRESFESKQDIDSILSTIENNQ